MRISRRPSHGRGEYEVSENYNELTPRDLIDRVLILDMDGGWRIDSGTRVALQGGKARLRLLQNDYMQLHRQLAAALLMPHPVRSVNAMGSGKPILKSDRYAIE